MAAPHNTDTDTDTSTDTNTDAAASRRTLEVVVCIGFLLIGALVMWDSQRIGAGWGSDGPQSGYFPFWIGLVMSAASGVTLLRALRAADTSAFITRQQLRQVGAVLLPTFAFIAAIEWLGMYVAAALFIAGFMRWQGRFRWLACGLCGSGIGALLFAMFEIWFKVPLVKGPLEAAFGF